MMDEVRLAQDSLRTLAEETGGIAMVNQNDFAKGFDNIVRANSKYYVLGYTRPPIRSVTALPQDRGGDEASGPGRRARKGYAAPKGKAPGTAKRAATRRRERTQGNAQQPAAERAASASP